MAVERLPFLRSATVGIFFLAGSVDENVEERGITHFIEHMVFKGNKRMRGKELMRKIEFLGAHIDAFTSKEYTCIWIKVPGDKIEQTLSLFSNLISSPSMEQISLEKERGVVLEEIGVSSSEPESKLIDTFYENFFTFPLGHQILGDQESVRSFSQDTLLSFFNKHFTKDRSMVVGVGDVQEKIITDFIEKKINLKEGKGERDLLSKERIKRIFFKYIPMEIEQIYGIVSFPGPSRPSEDRYTSAILSTILGGGMSSRLFVKLREDEGLVYNIYSSSDSYLHTGTFYTFFSTSFFNLKKVLKIIKTEKENIVNTLENNEIETAKNLAKSRIFISLESPYSRMNRIFGDFFTYKRIRSIDEIVENIDRIKKSNIVNFWEKYLSIKPTLILLGREGSRKEVEEVSNEIFG